MTRTLTVSLDQLYRPSPGGIGTYVRGLVQGLAQLSDPTLEVIGLTPRGAAHGDVAGLSLSPALAPANVEVLTRLCPDGRSGCRDARTWCTRRRWPVPSAAVLETPSTRWRCTTSCGVTSPVRRRTRGYGSTNGDSP